MLLFVVRHGETEGNVKKLYYSQMDMPLTDKGRQQAMALRPFLSQFTFDRVYSSDLSRALETAQLMLPGCQPIQSSLLREYKMGWIDGMTHAEVWEKFGYINEHYEQFGGESPQDMCARLQTFLDGLVADPCDRALVFGHAGTMKGLLSVVLGEAANTQNVLSINCNIAVFRYVDNRWILAAWNLAGNLEGDMT